MKPAVPKYGETLKKFNREIYRWSMNSNLNVSNEDPYCCLFSTSDIKQSLIAQTFCYNSKKNYQSRSIPKFDRKKTVMKILFIGTTSFNRSSFLANEITTFWNLKNENLYIWLKAKDTVLSTLKI